MRIAVLKRRFVKSFCIKDAGIRAVDLLKAGVAYDRRSKPGSHPIQSAGRLQNSLQKDSLPTAGLPFKPSANRPSNRGHDGALIRLPTSPTASLLLLQKRIFLPEKGFQRERELMGANEEIVRRISL